MKFRSKVAVQSASGRFLFSTHADDAQRKCSADQAIRLSSGLSQLTTGTAAIRSQYVARGPKLADAPRRRNYHDRTSPKPGSPLPHLFRSDTGQTGALRHVSFREVG